MTTVTMNHKGQVTIPAKVRRSLGVNAGDKVEIVELEPGQFLLVPATESITALKRKFKLPKSGVSIGDMNQAIAIQGAKARTETD